MPAFLIGAPVDDSMLTSRNELRLTVRGRSDVRPLAPGDTVFARARELGINAGVAGFFLRFCALVGPVVTTCSWQPCVTCGRMVGAFGSSVGESMTNQLSELAPRYGVRRHLARLPGAAGRCALRSLGPVARLCADSLAGTACAAIYDWRHRPFSLTRATGVRATRQLALADGRWGSCGGRWSQRQLDVHDGHALCGPWPPVACRRGQLACIRNAVFLKLAG